MDREDPTLEVEAALRDEEELAVLAELGAPWTAPDEEASATPPGDAAASPGEPGSDSEKAPSGPPQKGRDKKGYYVYGVTHAPLRERGLSLGLQPPEAFTREGFSDLLREAYTACSIDLQETATFKEPHEDGAPHNYALVRAAKQHRASLSVDPGRVAKVQEENEALQLQVLAVAAQLESHISVCVCVCVCVCICICI